MTDGVPQHWEAALASLVEGAARRVLILGPVDAGKSSLASCLLEAAVARGRAATLLDADLGQKMVGPPAAVTLSRGMAPDVLAKLAFVGTTDPVAGMTRLVEGVGRLCREAPAELLVVNSSGLLRGAGRRLKAAMIAVLQTDLLVAIGEAPALDAILADHSQVECLRLSSSPEARRKGPGSRRAARREAFRRHLEGGLLHELPLSRDGPSLSLRQLVGIVDRGGRDLALGLVEALDTSGGRVWVRGPAQPGEVASLVPGQIRLNERYDALAPGED